MRRITFLVTTALLLVCGINNTYADVQPSSTVATPSGTLPVMYIETENHAPIVSKTVYVNAQYWLDPMGNDEYEALGSASSPMYMQIRGRGHSSWRGEKKPYKIKFTQKTLIMGMPWNKHFALLKPHENTVAGLLVGKFMNMGWTPSLRPVEVVLNGDYIGLYFLTETISIDENRVNIFEQQDQETDQNIIPYGWLVEVDNYHDVSQITIPECSKWNLTLRYHSPEILSGNQLQWLTNEFKAINAAVYSTDKTSTEWEKYLDVESMARYFIVQEVMDNPDGFHGSFYLHKDWKENAKWVAGPVWDLTCYNRDKTDYTFRMKVHYGITPHWIGEIIQYASFCDAVKKVWEEVYPAQLSEIYEAIDDIILPLASAWKRDCERWNEDPTQTAQLRADKIKNALRKNIAWFDRNLPVSKQLSTPQITVDSDESPVRVFNLQGICIGEYENESQARSQLRKGIYIINRKKVVIN